MEQHRDLGVVDLIVPETQRPKRSGRNEVVIAVDEFSNQFNIGRIQHLTHPKRFKEVKWVSLLRLPFFKSGEDFIPITDTEFTFSPESNLILR